MKVSGFIPLQLIAALTMLLGLELPAMEEDQTENIQRRIAESDFIVDICVYEMEWIPPTPDWPKAKWIERAVVTGVHKGSISVGTKLEYRFHIEDPPKLFRDKFRAVVEGELHTFFFSADGNIFKEGKWTVDAPGGLFRFERREDNDFAVAFREQLKNNARLRAPGIQYAPPGTGTPSK
jgi:hypothetical protein